MPVPFIVEPDAFNPGTRDRASWVASHERLLQTWGQYGVLVLPKGDGIIKALAQLPQQVRTKWHIALKSARFRRRIIEELDLSSALESLERLVTLSRQIKLACLEETRAVCFGLDEDRLSIVAADGSFEICKLDFADQSHFFRSEAEWNRMIYAGESRNDIWRERFQELALDCSNIAVIDRYCLGRFDKLCLEARECGLIFFLQKLSKLPRKRGHAINIYASELETMRNATMDRFGNTVRQIRFHSGTSVHVHIVPDDR